VGEAPAPLQPVEEIRPPRVTVTRGMLTGGLAGLVALLFVGYIAYQLATFRAPARSSPSPALVVPTFSPFPSSPPGTPPPVVISGVQVTVRVTGDAWILSTVDGGSEQSGIWTAGTVHTFAATTAVRIRTGNAGSTFVTLNGRDLGVMGGPGQVVDRTFSRNG
jgi:hypothetical protein